MCHTCTGRVKRGGSVTLPTHLSLFILERKECSARQPPPPSPLSAGRGCPGDGTTDRVVTMSCVQPSSTPAPAHLINIVIFLLLSPSPAQPSPAQPRRPGSGDHLSNGNSPLHRNQKVTFPIRAAASCTARVRCCHLITPHFSTCETKIAIRLHSHTFSTLCPNSEAFLVPSFLRLHSRQSSGSTGLSQILPYFFPYFTQFTLVPPGRYRMSLQARPCVVCRLRMVMDI